MDLHFLERRNSNCIETLTVLAASGQCGMTQVTSQLTAYFSIFPISTREDLLSVHALVNFKTVPSGQLMSKRTFVCTHPNSVSPHAPYLHCLLALTRECRIFNSSGVSSAQLDKATRSDRSLTGGISPRDIAPK